MDLEEAKLKSKITPKERQAVDKYINSGHASMNALIGFSVTEYLDSSREGWLLHGLDTKSTKTKEEIGEEALEALESAADVYSAMYKNMYEEQPPTKLMRGTSDDEARQLYAGGQYNRIISTTTDEITAKSFGRYGNAAFLRIIAGYDIPFINVDTFVGRENLDRYESEYILAPFTRIKSSTFRSNWNGYKYYDVELEKPQLREFEEGEKERFQVEIREKFADIIEKGKELKQLKNKYEWLSTVPGNDAEDRAAIARDRKEVRDKIDALMPEIRAFESIMHQYTQGLFVEREREFKIAYEVNRAEEMRIWKEELQAKQAESIKNQQKAFAESKVKFHGIMDKSPDILTAQYNDLKIQEMNFADSAKILRNSI